MAEKTGISGQDDTPLRPGSVLPSLIADWAAMLRFYSRLPLPALGTFDRPDAPPPFARACRMLPLASVVIVLPGAAILLLAGLTVLPALFVATLAVAVQLAMTGALHEDGLADMADGFGGGQTIAQRLDIMKDSRIGAFGAAALGLALIGRISLLGAVFSRSPSAAAACLIAAAVVSRSLSLAVFATLPQARPDGVAASIGRPDRFSLIIAGLLTLLLVVLCQPTWPAILPVIVGIIISSGLTIAVARLALAKIGGQTGDVLGAVQVMAEIGYLAGICAV